MDTIKQQQINDRLFEAAPTEPLEVIKELASEHPSPLVKIKNSAGQTLLHIASGYGRTNLVSYLIKHGCDVNAEDSEGQTPLHSACSHAHSTIAKKLIDGGAIVDPIDCRGWSPLHFALSRKANADSISPIYWKVIKVLLESGANPYIESLSGTNCLSRVKDKQDRMTIRLMHVANLKPCDSATVANIDRFLGVESYFELIKNGDSNMRFLHLLTGVKHVNYRLSSRDKITPLHRAAGYNQLETAKLLIQRGAEVNRKDDLGRIPLHNAAQYEHTDMIELLVAEKSDINKQDINGLSPLHVAAECNATYVTCLKLVELGADINLRCRKGKLPYDLASDEFKEVLEPNEPRLKFTPSTSGQVIYIDIQTNQRDFHQLSSAHDMLMLNSISDRPLFTNSKHSIKKVILQQNDPRYIEVKKKMLETIMVHDCESGGNFKSYEILSIELVLNTKVWSKYRLMCQRLEIDYGPGSRNEKLLFHGSNFIDKIQSQGFDERYAQRDGMFGAGIYFAEHSSKSNQYTFGWGQGCSRHMDKSCNICERKMVFAQVALGRSQISKEAMPHCAHAPPGFSSVTGSPESTENLLYPEYVIYNGDQAYPLFVISYKVIL